MKETKEEIKNYLKKYRADNIKLFYEVMTRILLGNQDFRLVMKLEEEDMRDLIEEESGRKINFSYDTIICKDDVELYREIDELELKQTKLTKAKRVELMADVLGNDTLFEGFCLAFYDSEDRLKELCEYFGCIERYQECALQPVYKKRRSYRNLIAEYTTAATNLYGVIHVSELMELIWEYEKSFRNYKGYTKETGAYKNTIMFTPEYLCTYTAHSLVGNSLPTVCTTLDGFIVHSFFEEDYQMEQSEFVDFFKGMDRELTEDDLDRFYGNCNTSFRCLHDFAGEKGIYLPEKKEFLRYADEDYHEESLAGKQLKHYIEKNFLADFSRAAKEEGISAAQCINDFMCELYEMASDRKDLGDSIDPKEFVDFLFGYLQEYGISFEDIEQANELLSYAMKVVNSVRLWANHGYTPEEVRRQMPVYPEKTVIVPGSSHAAALLKEGKSQMEKMGFNVDLDASASQIPVFGFCDGVNGGMKKGTKKIYPNDPCPCGSGKKYKKCCGR